MPRAIDLADQTPTCTRLSVASDLGEPRRWPVPALGCDEGVEAELLCEGRLDELEIHLIPMCSATGGGCSAQTASSSSSHACSTRPTSRTCATGWRHERSAPRQVERPCFRSPARISRSASAHPQCARKARPQAGRLERPMRIHPRTPPKQIWAGADSSAGVILRTAVRGSISGVRRGPLCEQRLVRRRP